MEMPHRLPLNDRRRQEERDRKLLFREEILADRQRQTKRVCKCNICLGENHSLRLRTVVSQHLHIYGRHPYHRGTTQVRVSDCTVNFKFRLFKTYIELGFRYVM